MSCHYKPLRSFSCLSEGAEAVTRQESTSWNKAISVLCLTLSLHCRAGKGSQGGWSPKPLQTTAGPSLGHSSIGLQGLCACGQKENLHCPAAPQHPSVCHLNSEIFCSTPSLSITHLTHTVHKTVLISWQMVKLTRQWLHLFLHFHLHYHCLQNVELSVQGTELQRHNYWTSCCSGKIITVPQLLWHLITSINITYIP